MHDQAGRTHKASSGCLQVGNLAYMSRLGLWGPGTAFPDFGAFLDSMKARGVSFLELLAMEMKAEGFYLARSLSFRRVVCSTEKGVLRACSGCAGGQALACGHTSLWIMAEGSESALGSRL